MLHTKEETFIRHIKTESLSRFYILAGQENYLKEHYQAWLVKKALEGGNADFNLHEFDGGAFKCRDMADALEAFPMMGGKNCALVKGVDLDKIPLAEYNKLKEFLKDPPEESVAIFVCTGDFNTKKSARCRTLEKLLEPVGQIAVFYKRSESDLYRFAVDRAAKFRAALPRNVFRTLNQMCGGEMLLLKNETDKVAAYCEGREITLLDLETCCCPVMETTAFELSRAVIYGNFDKAMEILGQLLYLKEEPVAIVGAMAAGFIDIYRAKTASLAGKGTSQILAAFDYKGRDFRVRNAMMEVSRCSTGFLRGAVMLLTEADTQLKSSRIKDQIILEKLITQLFMLRKEKERID